MLKSGMFIGDRYEILERIGSGGMSDVYKAKDHKLNRFVAVKVLKAEFSEDRSFVSKFRVEAQSAASLIHANIVNVYDVGEENGIHYIVMELVEGITLKRYIEKKGRLGVREAVSIAIQVAQGIENAHTHHIIHRDIKPQNIIISREGKVKVTDFGIARAASSNTISSNAMGSVHYISPEQARGGYSDAKSDIYSFGIMLFEMVTGRVPFEGDTTVSVALQHIQDDITPPSQLVPSIPVSVEKIILKCTQKKTEKRYQNMSDLISDLKRSLVTPDEDFVNMNPVVSSGPTKMITEEERERIQNAARVKRSNPEDVEYYEEGFDEEYDFDYPDDDLEEPEDNEKSSAADKLITALGISVAVIIVIITMFIIFKMISLISSNNGSNYGPNNNATTIADDGKIEVPQLTGHTLDEVKTILSNANLGIKTTYEYSSYDEGTVIEQSIEAGTRISLHTTIVVTVSQGTESFSMVNVVNMAEDAATTLLTDTYGLNVKVEYKESSTIEQFNVISSSPAYLTKVKSGDTVTLYVSTGDGKMHAEVPELVGKTIDEAKTIIAASIFELGTVKYEQSTSIPSGQVIAQSGPAVGKDAAEGDVIGLVVSSGDEYVANQKFLYKTVNSTDLTNSGKVPEDATFVRLSFHLDQGGHEETIATVEISQSEGSSAYQNMVDRCPINVSESEKVRDFSKGSAQLKIYAYYTTLNGEGTEQLCTLNVTITE